MSKDEFVGAPVSVGSGKLDRISCIAQVNPVDPHDPTGIDVEANHRTAGPWWGIFTVRVVARFTAAMAANVKAPRRAR